VWGATVQNVEVGMVEGEHPASCMAACANTGVTVMADSNAAAATVLSEVMLISPVSKLSRNRGTRERTRSGEERALLWT
jgi:hypothetical protein